jgi:hypothetical protein
MAQEITTFLRGVRDVLKLSAEKARRHPLNPTLIFGIFHFWGFLARHLQRPFPRPRNFPPV